ncbi:hypothetical protein N7495_007869 [Penicillium taxi]|uniref:uncharacterized protein n=1 Tax=Penicillium taxi TaxID=168475 RepID=UPI002544D802|nr:uncharacterized protein N7495_007869 [Penicillium taxi]KAJ5887828.1 hypothetical protein N7495_007869 [Penicillium taxi]
MGDAVRPSDDQYSQALQDSFKTWSSYLDASKDNLLPHHAIELRHLVNQTPPFLGGLASLNKTTSFAYEEKQSPQSKGSLLINGRSTWRTSEGNCDSKLKVMSKQLVLAVDS